MKGGDLRMNLHDFLLGQNKGRWGGGGQAHQEARTDRRGNLKCSRTCSLRFLLQQQHNQLFQQNHLHYSDGSRLRPTCIRKRGNNVSSSFYHSNLSLFMCSPGLMKLAAARIRSHGTGL